MNYLVFLDAVAGELEKILSGLKNELLKEMDPTKPATYKVKPGDCLYFLRDNDDFDLRVKATVVNVIPFINGLDEELSHTLKELQPKLQLTEAQYNYWADKKQVLLVEIEAAHKIPVIHVAPEEVTDRTDWIPFTEYNPIKV